MALNRDFNPFANLELRVPESLHGDLRAVSRTQSDGLGKDTPEDTPFNRYVDAWTLAMAVGVFEAAYTPVEGLKRRDFILGSVLQGDLQRIELLMLVAIAHSADPFVVGDPRKVLDIAEGYAAGGLPLLIEMSQTGHLSPLRNLTRELVKRLGSEG